MLVPVHLLYLLIASVSAFRVLRTGSLARLAPRTSASSDEVGTCTSRMQAHTEESDGVYWNTNLGIWQDATGKACVKVLAELEKNESLFVFGYGSLIWRPGELLERYPSFDVDAIAYQRLFAQRSYDHRGTPRFPGLVLTVHPIDKAREASSSTCSGRVFLVPDEDREQVMEELDFREKGGYTRTVMEVRMRGGQNGAPHAEGDTFRAIVYYAEQSNPLFFEGAADLSDRGIHATANLIAAAEGPSGHNSAYLLQLSHYLYENKPPLTDAYLISLSRSVYSRSCLWSLYSRGLYDAAKHCLQDPLSLLGGDPFDKTEMPVVSKRDDISRYVVLGWGSNEYSQMMADKAQGVAISQAEKIDFLKSYDAVPTIMLLAGGGSSGLVHLLSSNLEVWGQIGSFSLSGILAACLGHGHGLALHNSGKLVSFGDDTHGQCSGGPEHLCTHISTDVGNEATETMLMTIEEPHSGFCQKAACGLRHSAAIDNDGRLHTWGAARHGQVLSGIVGEDTGIGPPLLSVHDGDPLEPMFIDVACGARHTVAVDNRGDVWGCGDNRHGSLGGTEAKASESWGLVHISGLPADVKWVSAKSGWSHVVVKGVMQDGSVIFYCWGRCDLKQLPFDADSSHGGFLAPGPLLGLPLKESGEIRTTVEVWCGAEHTVAADSEGYMWVSGWDDHSGVSGEKESTSTKSHWTPVLQNGSHARAKVSHGTVMASHVAAGGAHTIFVGHE